MIGRDEAANPVIRDASLLRRHAEVRRHGERCASEDLGSSNGNLRNGRPINGPAWRAPGDEIQLVSARLAFLNLLSFHELGEGR